MKKKTTWRNSRSAAWLNLVLLPVIIPFAIVRSAGEAIVDILPELPRSVRYLWDGAWERDRPWF